jgi:hypothetical protein
VPEGQTVTLSVSAPAGIVLSSVDCAGTGSQLDCQVGNGSGVFQAVNSSGAPGTVTVRVGEAPGFEDPEPGDNTSSLTAP